MSAFRVKPSRLTDFVAALLEELAGTETRAAFWFYQRVVLPVNAQPIGGASPFPGSSSNLAGEGVLVQLTEESADVLGVYFGEDNDALSALIHLEVEREGQLQFRSYDSFEVLILGPALDSAWRDGLIDSGVIEP